MGVVLPYLNQPGVFALGAGSFVVAAAAVWILGKETRRLNWRKLPDKILQSIKRDNLIHSVFGRGWSGSYPTNFSFWHIADVQLTLMNVCFEGKHGHEAGVPLMGLSGHLHCDVTVGSAARRSRASMAHFTA